LKLARTGEMDVGLVISPRYILCSELFAIAVKRPIYCPKEKCVATPERARMKSFFIVTALNFCKCKGVFLAFLTLFNFN
jgi:hypothetical protein